MTPKFNNLVLGALFIAMGVITPMIFHMVGLGAALLPLFWAVAASVFFLPIFWAMGVAAVTPLVSMLITGMPPFPILILLMLELPALTLVAGLIYKKTPAGSLLSLLFALIVSRSVFIGLAYVLAPVLGIPAALASFGPIIQSLPGLLAILICIPTLLFRVKKVPLIHKGG